MSEKKPPESLAKDTVATVDETIPAAGALLEGGQPSGAAPRASAPPKSEADAFAPTERDPALDPQAASAPPTDPAVSRTIDPMSRRARAMSRAAPMARPAEKAFSTTMRSPTSDGAAATQLSASPLAFATPRVPREPAPTPSEPRPEPPSAPTGIPLAGQTLVSPPLGRGPAGAPAGPPAPTIPDGELRAAELAQELAKKS